MTAIVEPAPAKINLALHVRRRRDDGYHELETLFAFCRDGDVVTVERADATTLTLTGPFAAVLAGEATGERVWPLPLEDEHRELMKSPAADLVNSGGRGAHAIQGAAFLERFTGDVPWAHLDMAALPADLPRKYLGKGPSGWGVRLLVAVARGLAA